MNTLTELLCCLFLLALAVFGCSKIEVIDTPKKLCKDSLWVTADKATREKDTTTLQPIVFIVGVDGWENEEDINIE